MTESWWRKAETCLTWFSLVCWLTIHIQRRLAVWAHLATKSALSQILSKDHHNPCLSPIFWLHSSWNGYEVWIVEAGHHELYLHIKAFSKASHAGNCKLVHMLWDHSLTSSMWEMVCVIYLRGVLRVFPCTMSSPAFCYLSHHSTI